MEEKGVINLPSKAENRRERPISNGLGVIMLTGKQTDKKTNTQTDTTENNTILAARVLQTASLWRVIDRPIDQARTTVKRLTLCRINDSLLTYHTCTVGPRHIQYWKSSAILPISIRDVISSYRDISIAVERVLTVLESQTQMRHRVQSATWHKQHIETKYSVAQPGRIAARYVM